MPRVERIREGVRRFRREIFPSKRDLYESLAEKQKPDALFLTCGDSRIDPCLLTGTEPGEIFVERTPGNIVPVHDDTASVGVSASIEYSVVVLGVADIIVCGHSACGAMKALLHPEHLAGIPTTARWLAFAAPAVARLQQHARGLTESERLETLTKLNVLEQMAHLHTHPAVEARFETGALGIHGWFYEIHTGRVDAYNPATDTFEPWPDPD
jgi:carbonic anhydrase